MNRVNVGHAQVDSAQFSRADIQTGEIKSIEGDILAQVRDAITDQTESLGKSFNKSIDDCCKNMIAAVKAGGTGGGGGGTGGGPRTTDDTSLKEVVNAIRALGPQIAMGGGGDGEGGGSGVDPASLARVRRTQALSDALEDSGQRLGVQLDVLEEQLRENLTETIREFNATIIKTMGSFTRWNVAQDEITGRFRTALDLASSSMLNMSDIFIEDTIKVLSLGFADLGDSAIHTAQTIRKLADEGITSPMRLVQGDVQDVADEFKRLRGEAEDFGLDLFARGISFDQQNELLTTLIDEQRRGSIQEDFRSFETRQLAMEQLKFLGMVADNTGQSLQALLASQQEQAKTFEELQALGIITQEEAQSFKAMASAVPPEMRPLLQKIAESGGNTAVFAQKFPDLFEDLTKIGQQDLITQIGGLARSGMGGTELANSVVNTLQSGLGNVAGMFGREAASLMFQGREIQGFVSGAGRLAEFQENMGRQSPFVKAWTKFGDFFTNTFPIQWLKSISALAFNTVAIWANTFAHMRGAGIFAKVGSLFRGVGGWMKRLPGAIGRVIAGGGAASGALNMGKLATATTSLGAQVGPAVAGGGAMAAGGAGMMGKLGGALKGLGKVAGGVGTVALVGKDLYDLSQGDTSGENTGALIGTAIGGALGAGVGALFGGVGAVPGAMIGASLGNWLGEMAGGAISPGEPGSKSTAPTRAPMRPQTAQQGVVLHLIRQTELLSGISSKMERSISVQSDIAAGINKIGFENKSVMAATKGGGDTSTSLFAKSPSIKA